MSLDSYNFFHSSQKWDITYFIKFQPWLVIDYDDEFLINAFLCSGTMLYTLISETSSLINAFVIVMSSSYIKNFKYVTSFSSRVGLLSNLVENSEDITCKEAQHGLYIFYFTSAFRLMGKPQESAVMTGPFTEISHL